MTLAEITYQTIQKRKLLPKGSLVVVGVSGGIDSLVLLHVLHHIREKLGVRLHVATLDHGLRGQAGVDDARYVEALARSWGIPVTRGQVSVDRSGEGIESAARIARYNFLASIAQQIGTEYIAVAHHADDQAETVLMRILRGTGLQGIRAMTWTAPVPGHPDLTLIRPFLDVPRQQIELYSEFYDLQPREDATNSDTTLLRNRIRHEMLPFLAQVNPQISRTLLHMADTAAVDDDYMQQELQRLIQLFGTSDDDRRMLQRSAFYDLHPALQRRWVVWAASQLGADEAAYEHIVAAVELALRGETGGIVLLPGKVQLRVDYEAIVIEYADAPPDIPDHPLLPSGAEIVINLPGITPLPESDWQIATSFEPVAGAVRLALPLDTTLMTLRTRRPGDRFTPLGLRGHTQSIKEWMIDHKIPRVLRDRIPLLVAEGQIMALIVWPRFLVAADLNESTRSIYVTVTNVTKHNA